jgi:oxygen-independent coproporphyrinogen III oxidase
MAGIYIHIPFCRRKCHYCNFFSAATTRWMEGFLEALKKEIIERQDYLGTETVNTIYFGGGTPSLLRIEDLRLIIEDLRLHFEIELFAEITVEANPDDISQNWLEELKQTPVNRLSIGVQSFFDDDLQYLNRVHNGKQAFHAIEISQKAGYTNLSIDLIYGIPTLTEEKWQKNLDTFFSLNIPHLSAYALTVEKKTPLDLLIRKGKYAPLDELQSIRHFKILLEETRKHDFIHYEISNFSREGYYSRHNSLYWLGGNYLGLGPSAHSFNGSSRQWNVSSITAYISNDGGRNTVEEKEVLTLVQRYNEYVMTSLRTIWGCDSEHIGNGFGIKYRDYFIRQINPFIDKKFVAREGSRFYLTDEGKLFTDGITADLFMEE